MFVSALTCSAASQRPTADAAALHPFFKPLLEDRQAEVSVCCTCGDRVRHADAAVCSEGHATCRECLDGWVKSCAEEELRLLRQREGRVFCPKSKGNLGCKAAAFSDLELGRAVSGPVFESYLQARMRLLESNLREEMEEEAERKIQAELERLVKLDEEQRQVRFWGAPRRSVPVLVVAALSLRF